MKRPLILFYPDLPLLSKNELKVLDLLMDAGELVVPVYLEQERLMQNSLKREEIEKAARKDPSVLSPYTAVEKIKGKVVATPYHIKYAQLLFPIAQKLNEAAVITNNREFAKCLKIQAKALLDGSYEDAMAAWLKAKPYILTISIGPIEHYDNQLFFAKAPYQAWVGVMDKEGTEKLNNYKSIILGMDRKVFYFKKNIKNLENVKAKVLDIVLFSGLMARIPFVGMNLPMNLKMVEKYGSEVIIFNQVNDLRLRTQIVPVFNEKFSSGFRQGFSTEDLRRGSLRYVVLHELAHNYLYYKNATNLEELLPVLYELSATVLGLRLGGILLLKDRITNKQLESMIIAFICRSFYLIEKSKEDKSIVNYALGGAIFINFMLRNGAIKSFKGLTIPNFMKIFVSMHDLLDFLEYLLSTGTKKEAKSFIKEYK